MDLKRYKPPTRLDLASWQDQMREAFFEGISPDDMRAIVAKLVEKAKEGDQGAIKILLSYGIGSPSVNIRNAVIVSEGARAPLPAPPSKAMPGTEDRVADMARRATNGQAIFSPRDRKAATE